MSWLKRRVHGFQRWIMTHDCTPHPDLEPVPAAAAGAKRLPDGGCLLVVVAGRQSVIWRLNRQAAANLFRDMQDGNRFEPFAPVMLPWMG